MDDRSWPRPARNVAINLLGCCSQPVVGEEVTALPHRGLRGQMPVAGLVPFERGPLSARCGYESAAWTPRAAVVSGYGGASLLEPPRELLVDAPVTWPPLTPSRHRELVSQEDERTRLFRVVSHFVREATLGRKCSVLVLDNYGFSVGSPVEAQYKLQDEMQRLALHGKAASHLDWQLLGSWPLRATLGAHRAEESALVQNARAEGLLHFSEEELRRGAVLELRGGTSVALHSPMLLVEASPEHRDRLVAGLRVLRLYWDLHARQSV